MLIALIAWILGFRLTIISPRNGRGMRSLNIRRIRKYGSWKTEFKWVKNGMTARMLGMISIRAGNTHKKPGKIRYKVGKPSSLNGMSLRIIGKAIRKSGITHFLHGMIHFQIGKDSASAGKLKTQLGKYPEDVGIDKIGARKHNRIAGKLRPLKKVDKSPIEQKGSFKNAQRIVSFRKSHKHRKSTIMS